MKRIAVVAVLALASCGQSIPQTRLYRLSLPKIPIEQPTAPGCADGQGPSLVIDELRVDPPYEDPRMVYRETKFRLDRYPYDEWTAPLGELVADALASGYTATGRFGRVDRDWKTDHASVLQGRVVAVEEVDRSPRAWSAHVVLDLQLRDEETERELWSQRFDVVHPMPSRSPEGLAAATSAAIAQIVAESTPALARALVATGRPCVAAR